MTSRPLQWALAAVGLAIGGLAVHGLREATLSTHQPVDPSSRVELIIEARSHRAERTQSLQELVEAVVLTCRLQVNSDLVSPIEHEGQGRFRTTLSPTLDPTNRRQFRGCLEDWTIDHLRVDVVSLELRSAEPST